MRNGKKSVVGDPINFRGMAHAPTNEAGVVLLFGMIVRDLRMYVEEIRPDYPDCVLRRDIGRGWEKLAGEFEWDSNGFRQHGHDPLQCDMIICWHHNWLDCPAHIEVICLADEIKKLSNSPITRSDRPY